MTTETSALLYHSQEENAIAGSEMKRCLDSFPYFCSKTSLLQTPSLSNSFRGGYQPFASWPHLVELNHHLVKDRYIVIIKERQIGVSWKIGGQYALWLSLFKPGASSFFFSKGEDESVELLDKTKRVYNGLPWYLKLGLKDDNKTTIAFAESNSVIHALPSTEAAGVGNTATLIFFDEADHHPFADRCYLNAKPAIDSSGGQFVICTTVDKRKPGSLAKVLYREARSGKNTFVPLFFGRGSRPDHDEAFYGEVGNSTPETDLEGLTRSLFMEQNYPRTEEEALSSMSTVSAFDHRVLDAMKENTRNPVPAGALQLDRNVVNIYQDFHIGDSYVAASDASHGVGKDYAVTIILDAKTGAVVADICRRDLTPEVLAYHSVELLKVYKNPLWWPEDNDWGHEVILTAERLGYRNFGFRDKERQRPGHRTDASNRTTIWAELIAAINSNQIVLYNLEGLKQFYGVIRNSQRDGRIEAVQGGNDDYPMAVGIAWYHRDEAIRSNIPIMVESVRRAR